MDDELQYVNLAPAEVPASQPEAGGESSEGVLYVQDGMVQGPSGEQYVTIIQNGQTYAIPTSDYAAMLSQSDVITSSQDKTSHTSPKKDLTVPELPTQQVPVTVQAALPVQPTPPAPTNSSTTWPLIIL